MPIRINKYISESGYCSRREADKYIEQGAVTIDGKPAEVGSQVSAGQVVKVFGETISKNIKSVIIAYNKPVGVVSTTDADERNNIISAIGYEERIFPIGRLDKDSQGLILLTNEGDIVNKILRVNNNHDKEYFVMVNKKITPEFISRMQNGLPILGVMTRKCEVTQKGPTSFHIVLRQGLNRQIRRMCEHLGYSVTKLQRIRIMHIHLGDLRVGQYRHLTATEAEELYKKIDSSVKTEEGSAKKKRPQKAATPNLKSGKAAASGRSQSTKERAPQSKERTSPGKERASQTRNRAGQGKDKSATQGKTSFGKAPQRKVQVKDGADKRSVASDKRSAVSGGGSRLSKKGGKRAERNMSYKPRGKGK